MSNLMERASIQASGAVRAIRASVKGLDGIFRLLAEEHGETIAMLRRAASASSVGKRQQLWERARTEWLAHERAENTHVYPQLRELQDVGDEHARLVLELEAAVERVSACAIESEEWSRAIDAFTQMLELHTSLEEDTIFPAAQKQLGTARAVEIEGQYIDARRSQLHELKLPTNDNPADGR
jgi:hemerythrin superfamily protein